MNYRYTDDPFDATFADQTAEHMMIEKGLPAEYHAMARETCRWLAQILSKRDQAHKASHDFSESLSWEVESLRKALDESTDRIAQLHDEIDNERKAMEFWRLACVCGTIGFALLGALILVLVVT